MERRGPVTGLVPEEQDPSTSSSMTEPRLKWEHHAGVGTQAFSASLVQPHTPLLSQRQKELTTCQGHRMWQVGAQTPPRTECPGPLWTVAKMGERHKEPRLPQSTPRRACHLPPSAVTHGAHQDCNDTPVCGDEQPCESSEPVAFALQICLSGTWSLHSHAGAQSDETREKRLDQEEEALPVPAVWP